MIEPMSIVEVSTALTAICSRCRVQIGEYCVNDDEEKGSLGDPHSIHSIRLECAILKNAFIAT